MKFKKGKLKKYTLIKRCLNVTLQNLFCYFLFF